MGQKKQLNYLMANIGDKLQILPNFPNSQGEPFEVTSPEDGNYNCISWAAEMMDKITWPDKRLYWPKNIPFQSTLHAFIAFYQLYGYDCCDDGEIEDGYKKIAIFCKSNKPSHASRQLKNGMWTSKLGPSWDVMHTLDGIENGDYGNVAQFMKKHI